MENDYYGSFESGTADQYRAGLLREINDTIVEEADTWGLEYGDYVVLLSNELIRITK